MGKQQTKAKFLHVGMNALVAILSCLLMLFGIFCLNLPNANSQKKSNKLNAVADIESDINWIDIRANSFSSNNGTIHYINSPAQLAYLNYELTNPDNMVNVQDYTGHTFILEDDIVLNDAYNREYDTKKVPLWTPIEIGKNGKNKNITFNGNGHSIIGMTIKCDNNNAQNVGFFAEIVGGVFENVVFEDTKIIYDYHVESIAADNPERPNAPIELAVGVVAGVADSTYIKNVTIENPSITVTTENTNGHNFYVGTAVGKMLFSPKMVGEAGQETIQSINTITPTQWGLDTVNVVKTNEESTGLTLKIDEGADVGTSYGEATNTYFGGLVGVNLSSKIINSTLRDFRINPDFNPREDLIAGNYYVGGVAGMVTQITTMSELVVAAGLYNNLLINVELGDISSVTSEDSRYCGKLVGRVYSGGWIYNNIVIGNQMSYDDFWGEVLNSKIRLIDVDHDLDCIATYVGVGKDYFLSNNELYPECNFSLDADSDSGVTEEFLYCTKHNTRSTRLITGQDISGTVGEMEKYNFYFESTNVTEFRNFCENASETVIDGENQYQYTKLELLNIFLQEEGYLNHAILPIVKYEVGLTVNKFNPETGAESTPEEMAIDSIYQFRTWEYDNVNHKPFLGGYTGLDYTVTFVANNPNDNNSDAYWIINENGQNEQVTELVTGRTYQLIYKPKDDPYREGYEFLGWTVEGAEEGTAKWIELKNHNLIDNNGYYIFGKEQILNSNRDRRFIANWKKKEYTVNFVVRENGKEDVAFAAYPSETVVYGSKVFGPQELPVSYQGYVCVGWFLEENLPIYGEDADPNKRWIMGSSSENLMPGRDITLYTGWINNFTLLSELLDDPVYKLYNENYMLYFDDETGVEYHQAYSNALEARSKGDTSNTTSLLEVLEVAFNNLVVDPGKLRDLPAFDETLKENSCPFLYDYEVRMMYSTFKNTVEQYIISDETDVTNIEGFIKNYDRLNELFYSLNNNLNESVLAIGGVNALQVDDLIDRYKDLQSKNSVVNKEKYEGESIAKLEEAQARVEQLWNSEATNPNIKDIELAIEAYESALKNLKPVGTTKPDDNDKDDIVDEQNAINQLPVSPMMLGIIIVGVLFTGVIGYIGVDVALNKRRIAKKREKQVEQILEDQDTYI